jgi:putative ABC transport system substrate-binding protein
LICFLITAASAGQQRPHIAVLAIGSEDAVTPQVRGLYDGLEEAGYVNGKNLKIQNVRAENAQQLNQLLNGLVRQTVDVIVTTSANETVVARQATRTIPIIFVPSIDPVGMGFVKSRAIPDSNLTGLSFTRDIEDNGKQLLLFKQVVPTLRKVITFYDGQTSALSFPKVLDSINRVAQALKIQISQHPASSSADAARFLSRMPRNTIDGVFVICSAAFSRMTQLAERATEKSTPLFGCTTTHVLEEGALMTYTPDMYYIGYRGAWYVNRILKGAKPQELPVETPTKFELVVNLKTARRIGVTIPPEVLILADRVFQ